MPTANVPGNLHIDRYLTNIAVDYVQSNDRFVSDKAFPVVPVDKASDKYVIFDRADMWRDEMKVRPLGESPDQMRWRFSDDSYSVEERALEYVRDDRIVSNQDSPIASDERSMRILNSKAQVNADIRWATAYFSTSIWTGDQTGVAAGPIANQFLQFDQSGSDPIGVVQLALDTVDALTGLRPNIGIFGVDVVRVLKQHADIVDRVKHTQLGVITDQLLAQMFDLDKFLVPRAIKTTSAEGAATATFARIVNAKAFLLVYAPESPALDEPSGGYTFAWTGLEPGFTNVLGGVTERGRDDRAHSSYFQIRTATDMKLVAADVGKYHTAAVA